MEEGAESPGLTIVLVLDLSGDWHRAHVAKIGAIRLAALQQRLADRPTGIDACCGRESGTGKTNGHRTFGGNAGRPVT